MLTTHVLTSCRLQGRLRHAGRPLPRPAPERVQKRLLGAPGHGLSQPVPRRRRQQPRRQRREHGLWSAALLFAAARHGSEKETDGPRFTDPSFEWKSMIAFFRENTSMQIWGKGGEFRDGTPPPNGAHKTEEITRQLHSLRGAGCRRGHQMRPRRHRHLQPRRPPVGLGAGDAARLARGGGRGQRPHPDRHRRRHSTGHRHLQGAGAGRELLHGWSAGALGPGCRFPVSVNPYVRCKRARGAG